MKRKALTVTGWLISIAVTAYLLGTANISELIGSFASADIWYLALATIINIGVLALKGIRWQLLILPQKKTAFWGMFKATTIGYAANNILPARGGDLLKIFLVHKWEGVSKTMLFSVTALDKIFDGLTLLILFAAISLRSQFPKWVKDGTIIFSIALLILITASVIILARSGRLEEKKPSKTVQFFMRLASGLKALTSAKIAGYTFIVSLVTCIAQIVMVWCTQMAFGERLDAIVPALVYIAINLAIMVPAAPSGVGPFEAAAVLAYAWLGIPASIALAIAIAYHAIQLIPTTMLGAVFYAISLTAGEKVRITKNALISDDSAASEYKI